MRCCWTRARVLRIGNGRQLGREAVLEAIAGYLDPDGDGRFAQLVWETMEQRGTIGFYVYRESGDGN